MKNKILFILAFISTASYSQTISTDAPSISASGITVPQYHLQIESSLSYLVNNDYLPIENSGANIPFVLLRYGLLERLELRATSAYEIWTTNYGDTRSYYTSFGFGAKYEILNKEGPSNLAVLAHYTSSNYFDWIHGANATVAFSRAIGKRHSIGANLGFELFAFDAIPENFTSYDYSATLIYGISISDKFSAFVEGYSSVLKYSKLSNGLSFDDVISYGFDFGVLYLLSDRIQLDYSSNISLSNRIHSHALGFNIMLPLKKQGTELEK